jgi:DinB superfamily
MENDKVFRKHLEKLLDWQDAHASFDSAIEGIPEEFRGVKPKGMPYSLWQLVEHLRICQLDILDFCRNPDYKEPNFPDDLWPKQSEPPKSESWNKSLADYRKDREDLKQLASDTNIDLFAKIPHGSGQTYLRELLLVADHNAYHVGEIVAVRRLLGIWKH